MPSTSAERRARWPGGDAEALSYLVGRGYVRKGVFWTNPKCVVVTERDEDAVVYLIEEWDWGGWSNALTFDALRLGNVARLPEFKNAQGLPAHSEPDGSDWKLSAWSNAVGGELGELAEALVAFGHLANRIKKIERGDLSLEEARAQLASEMGDVVTYVDLLAYRSGIDLGHAVARKWNEVSARVGSSVRLVQPR